jgi:hypothetical protein
MSIERTHAYKIVRSLNVKTLQKAIRENPYFLDHACIAMSLEYALTLPSLKKQVTIIQ